MTTTFIPSPQAYRDAALNYWNAHPFYAPGTVVLGIDIGIEGIGIAVRQGTELLYCKTLLVDLPEAQALAARRAVATPARTAAPACADSKRFLKSTVCPG